MENISPDNHESFSREQTWIARNRSVLNQALVAAALLGLVLLATINLQNYPHPWFDEGSHLRVPKSLVLFGVYADYSSEGFRHYGPTIGVGPTVLLPIAAAFRLFGIGLLQARLVMSLYLVLATLTFFLLAHQLGGPRLAWPAVALLISSRSVSLLEYGRQVLGEIPALFFLVLGLVLWFSAWEKASWKRLVLVGLLLGLAMITKYQFLLFLVPTLGLTWLAHLFYYRTGPQRVILVPSIVAGLAFGLWQLYLLLYLGPSTIGENLAMLSESAAGAALSFNPAIMAESLEYVLSRAVFMGSLIPVLAYGLFLATPRQKEGEQWFILITLVLINLVWYVLASIGWVRYAFLGMSLVTLFVARFFHDLTNGFSFDLREIGDLVRGRLENMPRRALAWAMLAWLILIITAPLGKTTVQIATATENQALSMAAYMDREIPQDTLVETWEPEMGFLTDHNYHFPPPSLLSKAVAFIYLGGDPPHTAYDFPQETMPEYILAGEFSKWVEVYPADFIYEHYEIVTSIGDYDLYHLRE